MAVVLRLIGMVTLWGYNYMTKIRFLLILSAALFMFFILAFALSRDFTFSVIGPFLALTLGVFMGAAYQFDWSLKILYCTGLAFSALMVFTSTSIKSIWNIPLSFSGITLWIVLGFIGLSTGT